MLDGVAISPHASLMSQILCVINNYFNQMVRKQQLGNEIEIKSIFSQSDLD